MTSAQRQQFKKLLLQLRDEITGKGRQKIAPNRTSEEKVGGDEDDQPLNEMLQAIASNRNKNNELVLIRVEKALTKLEQSPEDYGACEECGEDIATGRLKAMPYAELCVGCQGGKDSPKGRPTRRKITDYT